MRIFKYKEIGISATTRAKRSQLALMSSFVQTINSSVEAKQRAQIVAQITEFASPQIMVDPIATASAHSQTQIAEISHIGRSQCPHTTELPTTQSE